MLLTDFPPELLIEFAEALGSDTASLSAFSRVCRAIYKLISQYLYNTYLTGGFDYEGRCNDAYFYALDKNNPYIMSRLLDQGMDINEFRGRAPLMDAITARKLDMMKLLLLRGADANKICPPLTQTPLEAATSMSFMSAMDQLLNYGATLRHIAHEEDGILTVSRVYTSYHTELWYLLSRADLDARDADGHSALSMAVSYGNLSVVEWLLNHGTNARQKVPVTWNGSSEWGSLLALAKADGTASEEMIAILKRFGAKA